MLSHIKKTCGYSEITENIDLASEAGEVMDLVSKPREYAKKFLEPRTTYVLVKVTGDETDENSLSYIPLLEQSGDKIKFSVTNPIFRSKSKGKPGAKGDAPKADGKEETPVTSVPKNPTNTSNKKPTVKK